MLWFMTSYGPVDVPPRSINQAIFPIHHIQSNLWISFCPLNAEEIKLSQHSQWRGEQKGMWKTGSQRTCFVWNQIKVWRRATWSKDGHFWWCWELIAPNVTNCITPCSAKNRKVTLCANSWPLDWTYLTSMFSSFYSLLVPCFFKSWFINNHNLGYFTNKMCNFTLPKKLEVLAILGLPSSYFL